MNDFDTFGNIISDSAPAFELPFRFAGGIYDKDTNLIRFGVRDYDPEVGRWTSKEPLGFSGARNWYVYAGNDGVNYVDVNGLKLIYYEEMNNNARITPIGMERLKDLSPIFRKMIEDLEKSIFDIHLAGISRKHMQGDGGICISSDNNIYILYEDGISMLHELMHAWNIVNNKKNTYYNEELSAVQIENVIRKLMNFSIRRHYIEGFSFGDTATNIPLEFEIYY